MTSNTSNEVAVETEERLRRVRAALDDVVDAEGLPGGAVALLDGDSTYYTFSGHGDLDTARDWSDESRQPIGCLSKVLIAYVAMMLVDRGVVSLDEPLCDRVPGACLRRDGVSAPITLRSALSHSTGVDQAFEVWNQVNPRTPAEYVEGLQGYRQIAEPGQVFAYNNIGTAVAAVLIENILQESWQRAVNTMLLTPLGISAIAEPEDGGGLSGLDETVVTGYSARAGGQGYQPVAPADLERVADCFGSTTIYMTPHEISLLARCAMSDGVGGNGVRVLSETLAREMRSPQIGIPGHPMYDSWGLGWLLFDDESFGFEAATEGQHIFLRMFKEEDRGFLVMTNSFPSFPLYSEILLAATDRQWPADGAAANTLQESHCVGTYEADGHRLEIRAASDGMEFKLFLGGGSENWYLLHQGQSAFAGGGALVLSSVNRGFQSAAVPIWVDDRAEPSFLRFGMIVLEKVSSADPGK
ncbi:serine hydrolase domain-containing protein [Streptomyces tendae]|uniref:serine hydrolase domain-containing protein n=1 Tax=Streptomyces tendae TaxID=1932 RepID=UPI00369FA639